MNTHKKTIRNLVATLAIAGAMLAAPAKAGDELVSLETAIRSQMEQSQQNILAAQREQLKQTVFWLDNPAVKVGPLEVIETAGAGQNHERPATVRASAQADAAALAEDILAKALRAPGLMGISRYIALPALELALESAK